MPIDSCTPGVLIVGVGPSGLTLALTLLKNGVPVRIIDKQPDFPLVQRGSALQPRTLEVFHYLGALADIQAICRPLLPEAFYKPGEREPVKTSALLPSVGPTPDIPYPNPVLLGQGYTQRVLRSHIEKLGGTIETETELRHFEQDVDSVSVKLAKHSDGSEENAIFRYLVGTDGGRSYVRKQLGLSFEGEALKEHTIHGELELEGLDTGHWHRWSDREHPTPVVAVIFRPTETKGQFYFIFGAHLNYSEFVADHAKLVQAMRDFIKRDDIKIGKVKYAVEYKPQARIVDKFSDGRVFIAGDAAHVHSPQGGQGLNTSVQDAFNLGWKLALVEKGLAAPSLLSTFSSERLSVAKRMVQETLGLYKLVVAGTDGRERGAHIKQLGINYRWSTIVRDERRPVDKQEVADTLDVYGQASGDILRAGDRAPDAPGLVDVVHGGEATRLFDIIAPAHHTVLVFCSDASATRPVLEALQCLPPKTVVSAVVYPRDAPRNPPVDHANLILSDREGHAFSAYHCATEGTTVVIVRPDGGVGGIVYGKDGVEEYFRAIFVPM